ncbi:hypothetical protein Taro_034728, partial [Colocasia esculenta]|nr:hypothetical protein [Colocasia esculenta]
MRQVEPLCSCHGVLVCRDPHENRDGSAIAFSEGLAEPPRDNIFCKGSVDTTILGVDTLVQNKGRNVKKSPSQVDTSPEQVDTGSSQVDTRDLSQGIVLPVWDSVSTHLLGRSTLLHLVSTHFDSGRHSPPLVSTLTPCQTQLNRGRQLSACCSCGVGYPKPPFLLQVDPTVVILLISSRRFEPFPPLLSSISSPSIFSHSSLSIIPDSTLLQWHPSSFLAVEQSQGLRQGPIRKM